MKTVKVELSRVFEREFKRREVFFERSEIYMRVIGEDGDVFVEL